MPRSKQISDSFVLERALVVISSLGPEGFTLADVAREVGLAPATLLQRYGSKRGLLKAALMEANQQLAVSMDTEPTDEENARTSLIELLCRLPDAWGSRRELADSLRLLRLDIIDPELHPLVEERFRLRRQRSARLLRLLNKKFSQEEAEAEAWELDALAHGLMIQWALSGDGCLSEWLTKGLGRRLDQL